MKMRDIMKTSPLTVTEVTGLGEAQMMMSKNRIRHLPVVRGAVLSGILSERDILDYRAKTPFREDWWRAPVAAAMVAMPQTAGPDDALTEVAGRLAVSRIGAMPIVERGELIGLVTVTDVLEAEVARAMS
jgi:acetoin utilization protein AcuB